MNAASHNVTLDRAGDERRRLESILRQATARNAADPYPTVTAMMRDLEPAPRALPSVPDASTVTPLPADLI